MCTKEAANVGYGVELSRLALAEADVNVSMQQLPYRKAVQMLKAGEIDMIPVMYEYDMDGATAAAHIMGIKENQYFILSGTDWYYTNPVSLERLDSLGLLQGQRYHPVVELYKRKNRNNVMILTEEEGTRGLIKLLTEKKVSAILQDRNAVSFYKSRIANAEEVKLVGTMPNPQTLVTGFSDKLNNQAELIKKFDESLAALKESGKYQAVLAKYNIKDWQ